MKKTKSKTAPKPTPMKMPMKMPGSTFVKVAKKSKYY